MIKKRKQITPSLVGGFFLLLLNSFSYSQQTPHYSQYVYNMEILNPAFVGAKADLSISLLSRQQWIGVEGAPETNTFSISERMKDGFSLGVTIINDQLGLFKSNNVNIDASYTIPTSQYGRVSFGLKGGMTIFNNTTDLAITPDNDVYPSIKGRYPTIGFGGLYYDNRFFIGLSIPNILNSSSFKIIETSGTTDFNHANYFLSVGSIFNITEKILFKHSTLIKYTPSLPVSVDLNSNFIYNKRIETGVSYRYKNSISALAALIINEKFRIGYSYEYQLASYGPNFSSHEIMLRVDFTLERNTRWLFHNRCYF